MKRRIQLLLSVMSDIEHHWGLAISSADYSTITRRYEEEGYPFLAVTLPTLDDALLQGLASGTLPTISGFRLNKGRPLFLQGLWDMIFTNGQLNSHPSIPAIRAIRQISRSFKKVFEVCSDDLVVDQIDRFREIDEGLPLSMPHAEVLSTVNAVLHGRMLFEVSQLETFQFQHGPGATAEKLCSVSRWDFPAILPNIASRFDISDFYVRYKEVWPCPVTSISGRLVAVPKTFDKPRLISIEPASSMYAQQGILSALDSRMSRNKQLSMRDQSRNKRLAQEGSIDGRLSTIDLSDASDRVSLALVEQVFGKSKSFLDLIIDVRTPAVSSDGEHFLLRKYASMGCALTFPVQMLVFRTIVIWALCMHDGDLSTKNICRWGDSTDVGFFGDDIIVPTSHAKSVTRALESFALKVNISKSFTTGLFRESCGGDYYAGIDVKPIYVRRQPPGNRHDTESIVSWAAMAHLLDETQLFPATVEWLSGWLQDLVGSAPAGAGSISVPIPRDVVRRYNKRLQRHEVKGLVAVPKRKRSEGSDEAYLAKSLTSVGNPIIDPFRLEYHGRPTSAFISRRWIAEY